MAGLIERSIQEMEETGMFAPTRDLCSIIEAIGEPPALTHTTMSGAQVVRRLQRDQPDGRLAEPDRFRLVSIWREEDEIICLSAGNFLTIFEQLHLAPASLYLVHRNCYGLHHFETPQSGRTFFIGTIMYALIWSHGGHHSSTNALLLLRTGCGLKSGSEVLDELVSILRTYISQSHTPHYLFFVASLQISRFVDQNIQLQLRDIRTLEGRTGHGAWTTGNHRQDTVKDFTRYSKAAGGSVVILANQVRHADIAQSLVSFVRDEYTSDSRRIRSTTSFNIQSELTTIERLITSQRAYIAYLQERAKVLSTVAFALLAREDAITSISIAQTARRDGSSMKTIAIMTMVFLPATFFAALFSIPSLDWHQSKVVQDKFWIYWVVTLPSTVAVFLVWYLITHASWGSSEGGDRNMDRTESKYATR